MVALATLPPGVEICFLCSLTPPPITSSAPTQFLAGTLALQRHHHIPEYDWNLNIYLFIFLIIYLFIYFGCVGSSFLCEGFLQLRQVGATPHRGSRASHHRGLSCCGAQAPDAQAQQLWLTGPVAPRHVGSSQTRARTRVPRISRQTPNHCATREAPEYIFKMTSLKLKFK